MDHALLRETRRSKKLTLMDVAKQAGCSKQLVSQYENGIQTLVPPKAQAILSALGLEVVIQKKGRSKK